MTQNPMKATVADVFYAYRLILGRDPDDAGLALNIRKVIEKETSVDHLRTTFLSSPEFIARGNTLKKVPLHDGLWAVVDPDDPDFGKAISRDGTWEPHVLSEILRHVMPGDVFVDVGANVGVMAFPVAKVVGATGKVIGFEPNPRNIQCLLHGIVVNKFENVTIYPFALSRENRVFSVSGGSNSYLTIAAQGSTLSQSFIGDDILSKEKRVDFIKLDIEGHEPAALDGLAKTIQRHQPTILCEFNPRCLKDITGIEPARFAQQIFDFCTTCTAMEYDGRKTQVHSVSALMELWALRNETAVKSNLLPDGMLHFDLILQTGR